MTATDAKWTERIRQWKESGKTAEEFAVGQPFKPSTLKWRASELRRAGAQKTKEARGDRDHPHDARYSPRPQLRATERRFGDRSLGRAHRAGERL